MQNSKDLDDLEARQLKAEEKLMIDLKHQKRSIEIRLRHMEAYCHSPTNSSRPESMSGHSNIHTNLPVLPERKVTDKDWSSLASQYRERDAMENLHNSKIDVLRGKQTKAYDLYREQKEQELEKMKSEQQEEIDQLDQDIRKIENEVSAIFQVRREQLEQRWHLQAWLVRERLERSTGLKYAALPDMNVEPVIATTTEI